MKTPLLQMVTLALLCTEPTFARAGGDGRGSFFGFLIVIVFTYFFGVAKGRQKSWEEKRDAIAAEALAKVRAAERDLIVKQQEFKQANQKFDEKVKVAQSEIVRQSDILASRDDAFMAGLLKGRNWLAKFIAEADSVRHDQIEQWLRQKKRPAIKSAEAVTEANREARRWKGQSKFLEYQLLSYKEAYPFLEEYEELILSEESALEVTADGEALDENVDRARIFLARDEYERLSEVEKNQLALNRYLERPLSKWQIGRFYERQVGYTLESQGYDVTYFGATEGLKDLGRDLIARKGPETLIVQAKCWSKAKTIHEKHIFQLFASTIHFKLESAGTGARPVFYSTTDYSETATTIANALGVNLERLALDKSYPMIKCNVSRDGEKIYHLPFDQQYDRIKIDGNKGEFYALTVSEAVDRGFRRAKRYFLKAG